MNQIQTELSSDAERRKPMISMSSSGVSGIRLGDIVRRGLAGSPASSSVVTKVEISLAEQIFTALADAKIWTSRVAMHMDRDERDRYFRQLDLLHDCDEWIGDESPVLLDSYKSFIRFMLTAGRRSKPSLALSALGNLLAVWQADADRLTIEFRTDGQVEWSISRMEKGLRERFAGTNWRDSLEQILAGFRPETWFG